MQRIERFFAAAGQRSDLVFIAFLLAVIAMLVVPLPRPLLDALVTFNMAAALALLLFAARLRSRDDLATLPPAIQMATLLRIAMTVALARLVLTDGDAGSIVAAIGTALVNGLRTGGFALLLLIVAGLFVIVRKTAVAVEAATLQFKLNALPVEQLRIDRELRVGGIDRTEAMRLHDTLDRRSHFYGAMDGAMKLVKGDALAAMLVLVVELAGGFLAGSLLHGMAMPNDMSQYALVTLGSGIASLGPALLCALAGRTVVGDLPAALAVDEMRAGAA